MPDVKESKSVQKNDSVEGSDTWFPCFEGSDTWFSCFEGSDTWFPCCLSDRSWTCIILGVVIFGIIAGAIAALIVTHTSIIEYYKPTPYVPPNKIFSVDYLWHDNRYDFYKEKETYDNARKICAMHNTTLLVFNSVEEEKEIDCYLNVRNNAEDRQLMIWLNETILFGGPLMYGRFASFYSENREEVLVHTAETIKENGCDVQKDFNDRDAIREADQRNTTIETIYNIVKMYGNHGLRASSTNGCWNFVRWNLAVNAKHNFICKASTSTASAGLISSSNTRLFSEVYCN